MKYLALLLALFGLPAVASTVTINGTTCGGLKSVTLNSAGDIVVSTDGNCATSAPPVVVEPSACPSGVRCIDRAWPIVPQETLAIDGNGVLAIKVKAGASGSGKLMTAYTSGASGNRNVAISSAPGDFSVSAPCLKSGTQSTNTYWAIGAANQSQCLMAPGQTYWVNIRHTNCAGRCEFLIRGY